MDYENILKNGFLWSFNDLLQMTLLFFCTLFITWAKVMYE